MPRPGPWSPPAPAAARPRLLVAYFVHALLDEGVPLERPGRRHLHPQGRLRTGRAHPAGTRRAAAVPTSPVRVDGAAIGTIHGLCRRLLGEQALKAGVDPSFGILEADAESLDQGGDIQAGLGPGGRRGRRERTGGLGFAGGRPAQADARLSTTGCGAWGRRRPRLHIEPGPAEAGRRARLSLRPARDALAAGAAPVQAGPVAREEIWRRSSGACEWLERTAAGSPERRRWRRPTGSSPVAATALGRSRGWRRSGRLLPGIAAPSPRRNFARS